MLAGSYLPLAACVGFRFFLHNWATFKLLWRVYFPHRVKCFTYCIKCIWLKCLYWTILHSTYDKTVQDVKFYEGWPLLGCLLVVFMINLHKIYILGKDFFRYFEFWYGIWSLGYFGGFLTPLPASKIKHICTFLCVRFLHTSLTSLVTFTRQHGGNKFTMVNCAVISNDFCAEFKLFLTSNTYINIRLTNAKCCSDVSS